MARKTDQADERPHEGFESREQSPLRRQKKAGLAGDHHPVAPMTKRASEQPLALALTVDVGGVEEVDAGVERDGEEVHELIRILFEDAADARASKSQRRHLEIGATKTSEWDFSSVRMSIATAWTMLSSVGLQSETFSHKENSVVVVGSGPAGAAAALSLIEKGVDVTLIEAGRERARARSHGARGRRHAGANPPSARASTRRRHRHRRPEHAAVRRRGSRRSHQPLELRGSALLPRRLRRRAARRRGVRVARRLRRSRSLVRLG